MNDFAGMEELVTDFLTEGGDLLASVDNKLVQLESNPDDHALLNDIFRGFHTIKGGAGFLDAKELVTLCHLTENLFDKLRNGELKLTPAIMDSIMQATGTVRDMFDRIETTCQPLPASPALLASLKAAIDGKPVVTSLATLVEGAPAGAKPAGNEPNWQGMLESLVPPAATANVAALAVLSPTHTHVEPSNSLVGKSPDAVISAAIGRRATDKVTSQGAGTSRRDGEKTKENSIRVDTSRLDHVLNLSGEIGLTKNRLTLIRTEILNGRGNTAILHDLDEVVGQLDLLVSDLQSAVMKTRMQPVGRLFQKYPRIARDLARSLGKEVDLVLVGEETEIDKTMIEDLGDPIIHLIRNAVDHGVELPAERVASGKPEKSEVRLEAHQEGDHIIVTVSDDGYGMNPERLRAKAVEKGLITSDEANALDEKQSFALVLLPGFSTKDVVSDVSGRGVGMDVVKTNIQKLNGAIDISSEIGKGTTITISLPLTLAILPVLVVRLGDQPFAVPLSMVREILQITASDIQEVGGRATAVIRGEVLPVIPLANMINWPNEKRSEYGVLMQVGATSFILAVDSFDGREDAVIKSLDDFRPKGVAGVTTLPNGQIVLILDMKELLLGVANYRSANRSDFTEHFLAA